MAKLWKDSERYWTIEHWLDFVVFIVIHFISPWPQDQPETPHSAARGFGLLHAAPGVAVQWDLRTKTSRCAARCACMFDLRTSFTTGSKKRSLGKDEEFHSSLTKHWAEQGRVFWIPDFAHLEERKREQQHHSILFSSLQFLFWIFLPSVQSQSPLASQLWAVKQRFSSMLDSASPSVATNHTAGVPYTNTRNSNCWCKTSHQSKAVWDLKLK